MFQSPISGLTFLTMGVRNVLTEQIRGFNPLYRVSLFSRTPFMFCSITYTMGFNPLYRVSLFSQEMKKLTDVTDKLFQSPISGLTFLTYNIQSHQRLLWIVSIPYIGSHFSHDIITSVIK